jgi:hypothetical protein
LYEAYERLFLGIPVEEHNFVQKALSLLCSNLDILRLTETPVKFLLQQLLSPTTIAFDASSNNFCTEEILKDSCGCLITIVHDRKDGPQFVRFAHYTVREFLFSVPLRDNSDDSLGSFALTDSRVKFMFYRTTFHSRLKWRVKIEKKQLGVDELPDIHPSVHASMAILCTLAVQVEPEFLDDEELWSLVMDFINPSSWPLNSIYHKSSSGKYKDSRIATLKLLGNSSNTYYKIVVIHNESNDPDAEMLGQMLVYRFVKLALTYLEGKDPLSLLQKQLTLVASKDTGMAVSFQCPIYKSLHLSDRFFGCDISSLSLLNESLKDRFGKTLDDLDPHWQRMLTDEEIDNICLSKNWKHVLR